MTDQAGVCELLLQLLRRHEESDVVTAAGLAALAFMAKGCAGVTIPFPNQSFFVAAGASPVVVRALKHFLRLEDACATAPPASAGDPCKLCLEWGCVSLLRLLQGAQAGAGREALQQQMAQDGACIIVTAAVDAHCEAAAIVQSALEVIDCNDNALITMHLIS